MSSAPAKIGPYEVIGELATGGMAEILLARLVGPSGFERPVVLKRILPHLVKTPQIREMFVDEARILAGLRHANIVQVDTLGEDGGTPYLAMEYLAGESAAGLLRRLTGLRRTLPLDLAAFIVAEAAAGLHSAHELRDATGAPRGLVHRDVSPQNIFITYDGAVKVLDFGIAKARDRSQRTETGQLKGKFKYMAPEQTRGEEVDRRCDVFALGIVLYELATGRTLFGRRTDLLTLKAITEEPITPPSRVTPELTKDFDAVCLRALKRTPAERFPTASDLRKELRGFVTAGDAGGEPTERLAALMREVFADRIEEKAVMLRQVREGAVAAIPTGDADAQIEVPSVIAEIPVHTHVTATIPQTPPSIRRARTSAVTTAAIAVGLVLAIGAGGFFFLRRRPPPVDDRPAAASLAPPPVSAPAPPASVVIRVSSVPEGARIVVDGADRGVTPASIDLPRGTTSAEVVLDKPGYTRSTQAVVPDSDAKLVVTLVKERGPEPPKPKLAPVKPRPASSPGFERFD